MLREEGKKLVEQMTLREKAALCVGADFWHIRGVPRLGLDEIMVADGPHGLRRQLENHDNARPSDSAPATCFPTASAVACTFDEDLAYEMGRAMGEECRQEGVSVLLGPGVNMKRSPLCGRNFEYFSEDPYLAGKLAAAMIRGVQSVGVGTSLKHFALNSQETNRLVTDSVVDARALREVYLRAFEIAVKEGRPWTVMTAYNKLNGRYCGEHAGLLEILRREWGFDGVTVSDWGAVHDWPASVDAGLDLEMPGVRNGHVEELVSAVEQGKLPEEALDRAAERVTELLLKARAGKTVPYTCDYGAHHALARRLAENAAVLLKNDGLLPGSKEKTTAVIGALAREGRYQGSGSSRIHPLQLDQAWDALHREMPGAVYEPGYDLEQDGPCQALIDKAVAAARDKEIVYLFAGLPDRYESEGTDRAHMKLPEGQCALIEAVCRVNPNTAVILQTGSPVEMPWADLPRSILLLYLGGEAAGSAAAALLLGRANPCGKLAETFPLSLKDAPSAAYYPGGPVAQHRESLYIGYRYYDAADQAVAYPFGHGLSYTEFAYSALTAEPEGEGYRLCCRVRNIGARPGCAVTQLYLAPVQPVTYQPPQKLIGFVKTELQPGEEQELHFCVTPAEAAYYSAARGRFVTEGGAYEVRVAASSRDIRLRCTVSLAGEPGEDLRGALPHYYRPDGVFPKEEFERLLGRPVPRYTAPGKGTFTLNTAVGELSACVPGRVLLWCARRCLDRRNRGNRAEAECVWRVLLGTPLRQAAMGGISIRLVQTFVDVCNGRYGQALKRLLS